MNDKVEAAAYGLLFAFAAYGLFTVLGLINPPC